MSALSTCGANERSIDNVGELPLAVKAREAHEISPVWRSAAEIAAKNMRCYSQETSARFRWRSLRDVTVLFNHCEHALDLTRDNVIP